MLPLIPLVLLLLSIVRLAFEKGPGRTVLNGVKTIFDGRKNVLSPKAINLGEVQAESFEVKHLFSPNFLPLSLFRPPSSFSLPYFPFIFNLLTTFFSRKNVVVVYFFVS